MKWSTILGALGLAHQSLAAYVIQDDYTPSKFVDMFNAFSGKDPTDGFVKYLDMQTGISRGLVKSTAESVILSVDSTTVTPHGRPSMRLESKRTYSSGLIIGDFAHMPGNACGTWPAFWTLGPNWPSRGEIDIMEGVNMQPANAMTLHTAPGCAIGSAPASFRGSIKTPNCDVKAPGQGDNVGCGVSANGANTYGDGFNIAGGGVYATEWTADHIAIYFFPRNAIPADITSGAPNPSAWGQPQALFKGACNIPAMFSNHTIVINTTFCGQWAGQKEVWGGDKVCSAKAATCNDYVANNPGAFKEAYWEINSLKVYQLSGSAAPVYPAGEPSPAEPVAPAPSATRRRKHRPAQATPYAAPAYKRSSMGLVVEKREESEVQDHVRASIPTGERVVLKQAVPKKRSALALDKSGTLGDKEAGLSDGDDHVRHAAKRRALFHRQLLNETSSDDRVKESAVDKGQQLSSS